MALAMCVLFYLIVIELRRSSQGFLVYSLRALFFVVSYVLTFSVVLLNSQTMLILQFYLSRNDKVCLK